MKHIIDIDAWERGDNWRFMRGFANSWYSVTTEVDCTAAMAAAHAAGESFFVRYLYAIMRAVNEVKELGYRADGDDGVAWYDTVGATVPVTGPQGGFVTVLIPYIKDYDSFAARVRDIIAGVGPTDTPYGVNRRLIDTGQLGVVNISATPGLYFTSMTYTFHRPGLGSDWPLINVGKVVERGGRRVMPLGIYVDHCFVDGEHLSAVVDKVQRYLDEPR